MNPPSVTEYMAETASAVIRFFDRSGCPLTDEQRAAIAVFEIEAAS